MSREASGSPLLLGRAAQILSDLRRQPSSVPAKSSAPDLCAECILKTAVLNVPLQYASIAAGSKQIGRGRYNAPGSSPPSSRDVHTEIGVTAQTLRCLQVVHGSLVEVHAP